MRNSSVSARSSAWCAVTKTSPEPTTSRKKAYLFSLARASEFPPVFMLSLTDSMGSPSSIARFLAASARWPDSGSSPWSRCQQIILFGVDASGCFERKWARHKESAPPLNATWTRPLGPSHLRSFERSMLHETLIACIDALLRSGLVQCIQLSLDGLAELLGDDLRCTMSATQWFGNDFVDETK